MNIETLNILCADDVEIAAALYRTDEKIKGTVMLCPATGITQKFYTKFATWLAAQGYPTITFGNRGIGKSLIGDIKKSPASIIDWGTLDMPAVLETLKNKFPDQSYHLIGHSAGGQLIGLMPNALDLKSAFVFASSSGNLSNMKFPFRVQAKFFMNFFIPLSNLFFGHTKSPWLGMGEPLPKKAAEDWARWCNGEGYLKTDFGTMIKDHQYDKLTFKTNWLYATDDDIAVRENVQEMQAVYSQCIPKTLVLSPEQNGATEIGHMGFFKSSNEHLWPLTTTWLDQHA